MTETNHPYKRTGKPPARAQQQQGPPCLTTRHRHTLSAAGRRAYGDGETTAGLEHAGATINKHHRPTTGTRKQATTQSATRMQHNRWKPFSLDKLLQERSHPPGDFQSPVADSSLCHFDDKSPCPAHSRPVQGVRTQVSHTNGTSLSSSPFVSRPAVGESEQQRVRHRTGVRLRRRA